MLHKSLAFGLLAAGFIIAPKAAFADTYQSQTSVQTIEQNGAAIDGSTNVQSSQITNFQQTYSSYQPYYYHYSTPFYSQLQSSYQSTNQSGAAVDSSVNTQDNNTVNIQQQVTRILNSQSAY
jgi:hypothetical protein